MVELFFIIKFIFIMVYKEKNIFIYFLFKTVWIVIIAACNGGVQQTVSLSALSVFNQWCIYIYIYLHIQVYFRRKTCHLVQEAPQPIINNQYVNSPAL